MDVKAILIAPPTPTTGAGEGDDDSTVAVGEVVAEAVGRDVGEERIFVAVAPCGDDTGCGVEVEAVAVWLNPKYAQKETARMTSKATPANIQTFFLDLGAGTGLAGATVGASLLGGMRGGSGVMNLALGAVSAGRASRNALANSAQV